jgi:hypothetical protein
MVFVFKTNACYEAAHFDKLLSLGVIRYNYAFACAK